LLSLGDSNGALTPATGSPFALPFAANALTVAPQASTGEGTGS